MDDKLLADQWWRLNNLYYIKDKAGKRVLFRPNWAQEELLAERWFLNVILKARQVGVTTGIEIWMLDCCLFYSNINAGVIAHNKDDAEAFFDDKIKYAYDNLPADLKAQRRNISDTRNQLKFSNKSRIRVGTSLRSGTYQILHVSEFGPMCAKYPEKAREVMNGALNTVEAGNYIFVESTAAGPFGPFYDMCNTAERLGAKVARGEASLTPLDYKFWFFPWWKNPEYRLDEPVEESEEQTKYFESLKEEKGILLDAEQRAWYVKKAETQQEKMKQEFPSTSAEAFERSFNTAILAKPMQRAQEADRICDLPLLRNKPVHTFWDLGRNDYTAIWFMQDAGTWDHFVYFFQDRLQDLAYYARILHDLKEQHGWFYGVHYLPHDVNVADLSTPGQRTRKQILEEAGVTPIHVVPRIRHKIEAIELLRSRLDRAKFDEEGCGPGLEMLREWRWSYDSHNQVLRRVPQPGIANHAADALCQWAQAYQGETEGFRAQQEKYGRPEEGALRGYRRANKARRMITNPTLKHVR